MTRRAFTITELLTVVAVIGVLLGLLIPAVLYARESARKAQCQNNLAQIGRAVHDYHSAHGRFPEAVPPEDGGESKSGLLNPPHVSLLPYIEQSGLFGMIDRTSGGGHVGQPPFPETALKRIPLYICPSDSAAGGNNYRACTGPDAYDVPTRWIRAWSAYGEGGRGVFVSVKRVSAASITDGLSNTVGFSEKCKSDADASTFDRDTDAWHTGIAKLAPYPPTEEMVSLCRSLKADPASFHGHAGATWMYVGYYYTLYNHSVGPNADVPDCEAQGTSLHTTPSGGVYKASSFHSGGVNCLAMDGAVKGVSDQIDAQVWRAYATREGGEAKSF